jgi:hypothetical protein
MNIIKKLLPSNMRKFVLPGVLTISITAALVLFTIASGALFNGGSAFGYGYGGGGGGLPPTTTPAVPATPTPTSEPLPPGAVDVSNIVTDEGEFNVAVEALSADGNVEVDIEAGVVGLDNTGAPITQLSVIEVQNPPPPPSQDNFIGIPYDFGPDGATFDPPITITFKYTVPDGTNLNDLVIAFYDESTGQWVELTDIVVDPVNGTISGKTSHFTTFAVLQKGAVEPAVVTPTQPAVQPTQPAIQPTAKPTVAPPTSSSPAVTGTTTIPAVTPVVIENQTPFNWTLIGILLGIVVVLAISLPLYLRRRD